MKKPIVALSLSLLALGISGCGHEKTQQDVEKLPRISVPLASASNAVLDLTQPVPGTVQAAEHATVSARIAGAVASADFAVGQSVRRGDVLVTLSANEIQARVAQARAAADQAQRDYERESGLLEKGAATRESVRDLEERLRIARASLQEAEAMLAYTRVEAPFDGRITAKLVNNGDLASPGVPLFSIDGAGAFEVAAQVPASLPEVELGSTLTVDNGNGTITGTLAELSPAVDPRSRTRLAKISLPDGTALRSGTFVRVQWPSAQVDAVMVPKGAVSLYGQIERVFVVENGAAQMRIVDTGLHRDGSVQILSGMSGGETVVAEAPAGLRNGQPVEAVGNE